MIPILSVVKASYSLFRLSLNPQRTEFVFAIGDSLTDNATKSLISDRLLNDIDLGPTIAERRSIPKANLTRLRGCPKGSLGSEIAKFFEENDLDPGIFPDYDHSSPVDYFRTRMGHTHDFKHVVTGFPANPAGEMGVQAFDFAQTPNPLAALLMGMVLIKAAFSDSDQLDLVMRSIVDGYLMGKNASHLFGLDWDREMDRPFTEVCERLNIVRPVATSERLGTRMCHEVASAKV